MYNYCMKSQSIIYRANSLKNHLLIAMPTLNGSRFEQAVTYLCEHNEKGAMGIVINKPLLQMSLGDILKQLSIEFADEQIGNFPVLSGGPVAQEQGFLIHQSSKDIPGETVVDPEHDIVISASKDVLKSFVEGKGPPRILVSLGYAGWSIGQLENELKDNRWLLAPATPEILFETPYANRWRAAAALVGVDFRRLSYDTGHG